MIEKIDKRIDIIRDFIIKYRYIITVIAIILGTLSKLSGSSIAVLNSFANSPEWGLIHGTPRGIRSDEWAIFTPMSLSQAFGDIPYNWKSSVIQGGGADVFIVYAQPVKDLFGMLFRPFLNGFIFLSDEYGISFFWCARFMILVLTWFEFSYRIITKENKNLSIMCSILIAFAPMVQWWFAINGLVEMLIFGPVAIMMIKHFLITNSIKEKVICAFVLYLCGGGFVATLYPASMIPLAYFYLCILIPVIYENRKSISIKKVDIVIFIVLILVFTGTFVYLIDRSQDTIAAVTGSVYPGNNRSTGGMGPRFLFWTWGNLFFAEQEIGLEVNACEQAMIFSVAPVGLILCVYKMIKKKKADLFCVFQIALMLLFFFFCVTGIPEFLSVITLLMKTHPHRAMIVIGLTNLILLIRGLDRYEINLSPIVALLCAFVYSVAMVYMERKAYIDHYLNRNRSIILLVISFICILAIIYNKKVRYLSLIAICGICIAMGCNVNPLQKGLGSLQTDALATAIQEVVKKDNKALWAVEGTGHEMTNYPIVQGAPTINTVQTYPNLKRWGKLDLEGKYEDYYNRYAYILFDIVSKDEGASTFEVIQPDMMRVRVTPGQAKNVLNLKYLLTVNELEGMSDGEARFTMIANEQGYYIYEIE